MTWYGIVWDGMGWHGVMAWDVVRNGPNIGEGAMVYALPCPAAGVAWGLRNQNLSNLTQPWMYPTPPACPSPQAGTPFLLPPTHRHSRSPTNPNATCMIALLCPAFLHCQHGPDLVGIALINQRVVSHVQEGRERGDRERERET